MTAKRPIPSDFAQVAPGCSVRSMVRRYASEYDVVARWFDECGIPRLRLPHSKKTLQIPADFAERTNAMNMMALVRHYGKDRKTIRRWLDKLSLTPRPFNPPASDRPRAQRVRAPAPKLAKPLKGRLILPAGPRQAPRDTSREGDAADYLKRWFVPVYRCTPEGVLHSRPHPTHYRLGSMIVTTEDMLVTARRKGWNPDAWMEVAA